MHELLKKFLGDKPKQLVEVLPNELYISSDRKGEVVLSDGRFATLFKVKAGHFLMSQDPNKMIELCKIMTMTVRVDDKLLTTQEVFNLDIEDFNKIAHHLLK